MRHHPANNPPHDHTTFGNTSVTPRLVGKPSIALSGYMLLDAEDFLEGACKARENEHEWEQQYRQRWKIE